MKHRLFSLPALGLIFAACESGGPTSSNFDPLDAAGGFGSQANVVSTGYRPGDFVRSVTLNTGFFKKRPKGEADADKLLPANTPMKVISDDGSFVKVELDSGEVGYVSTVQVMGENEVNTGGLSGSEFQVWPPPADGVIPLDDAGPVDPEVPLVPTDIDPDAPVEAPALPDDVGGASGSGLEIPPLPEPTVPLPEPGESGGNEEAAGDDAAAAPGE